MAKSKQVESPKARTASFLVRFWREETANGESVLRGYLRNLRSGEEQYVTDPALLGEQILRYLRRELEQEDAAAETGKSARAG